MLKRIASVLLVFCLALLAGCTASAPPDSSPDPDPAAAPVTLRIGGLLGPTSLGMLPLMEQAENDTSTLPYAFTLAASTDELVPQLVRGELDMAAIPANLAAALYQNTDAGICVLAVNTLGVLSLVEKGGENIQSIADLRGETVYATGKGAVPEYTLRHLLEQNGLNPDTDLTLEFRSEPTEVVSLLAAQERGIAMLPQPFVTVAQDKIEGLRIALDLTEAWTALESDSTLITGVMVARRDFVDAHPEEITAFLSEYEASLNNVIQNVEDAAVLSEHFGIVKADVARRAIPHCNLTFLAGTELKTALSGYLEVLYAQNPASVGNALPEDDFYFGS